MDFKEQEFTADQLQALRSAALECAAILGARGRLQVERDITVAIWEAMHAGCSKHADLVAVGLAVVRRRTTCRS